MVTVRKYCIFAVYYLVPASHNPAIQSNLLLFVIGFSIVAHVYFKPYYDLEFDKLEMWALLTCLFGHLLATFVSFEHTTNGNKNTGPATIATTVFLLLIATFLLLYVYHLVRSMYQETIIIVRRLNLRHNDNPPSEINATEQTPDTPAEQENPLHDCDPVETWNEMTKDYQRRELRAKSGANTLPRKVAIELR